VNVNHLVDSFGYLAVFALVGAESLGIPLPGETALIAAAVYAGHTHRLSPWLIVLVASAAAILGDNIGYWVGAHGGYRLLRAIERHGIPVWAGRWRRIRVVDERKLKIARYLFDRHGAKVVFFGRFVSVLRTYAAFLAGVGRMRWRTFLIANAAGGIVWAACFTVAGYYLGVAVERDSGTITLVTTIAAAVAVVTGLIVARRKMAALGDLAERAYPGPLP